jgi:Ca-activated chloride channel family protein
MDFARPLYLYLLGLIPLAILFLTWAGSQRRKTLARVGVPSLIESLSANVSHRRRRWKTALWFVALVAPILALARPLWGTQVTIKVQEGVEIMAVLDVSASMLAEDIKPNRLTRAKLTIEELMDRLGGNEVGLVIFSGAAFVQFPITADLTTARAFLEEAGPSSISRPGSALEEAIQVALNGFPDQRATSRVVLLLTDGEGHEGDALAAAQKAAAQGVVIHAIGFGSPDGEPIPIRDADGGAVGYKKNVEGETVLSRLDEITLQRIAAETGGLYFRASAGGEEIDAIADAIDRLETSEQEKQFEIQGVERFDWFAGVAILALSVEILISDRKPSSRSGEQAVKRS